MMYFFIILHWLTILKQYQAGVKTWMADEDKYEEKKQN